MLFLFAWLAQIEKYMDFGTNITTEKVLLVARSHYDNEFVLYQGEKYTKEKIMSLIHNNVSYGIKQIPYQIWQLQKWGLFFDAPASGDTWHLNNRRLFVQKMFEAILLVNALHQALFSCSNASTARTINDQIAYKGDTVQSDTSNKNLGQI